MYFERILGLLAIIGALILLRKLFARIHEAHEIDRAKKRVDSEWDDKYGDYE